MAALVRMSWGCLITGGRAWDERRSTDRRGCIQRRHGGCIPICALVVFVVFVVDLGLGECGVLVRIGRRLQSGNGGRRVVDALDDRLGFFLEFGRVGADFNLHGRLLGSRDGCVHLLANALQLVAGQRCSYPFGLPTPVAEGARTIGDAGAGHCRDLGRAVGYVGSWGPE